MRLGPCLAGLVVVSLCFAAAPRARAQDSTDSTAVLLDDSDSTITQEPSTVPVPEPTGLPPTPSASSNALNPAISAIGWFQAQSGNGRDDGGAFQLREVELGLQSVVDPYARADFFLSAHEDGELEVEEGYLSLLALPGGFSAKLGRFRSDFGKFNRTHPPETPFADRPRAALHYLGEDGLSETGASVTATVPNPFGIYWDVTAQAGRTPDEAPLFAPGRDDELLYVGRTSAFVDLSEGTNLNLGVSAASAPEAPDALFGAAGSRAEIAAADLTLRWKNPRRRIYRSLTFQVEGLAARGSREAGATPRGIYAWTVYQFARRFSLGGHLDYTELPETNRAVERGALALVQFRPSEFSTLSLQGRRVRGPDRATQDAVFLKWIFSIGPHGAHPF